MTGGDPLGAFVDEDFVPIAGARGGRLAGTTFVAKDLFSVVGRVTGAGQPTWAASHPPAEANAPAVQRLLDDGADLVGRTHTTEMAYSLSAVDVRAGMPRNPAFPDRDPGGSSTGSAVAVAAGRADLGLGTDTLGSIRVPASYGAIFGWRPTHGLVPQEAVHPLAVSLDTVGLLARDPVLLHRAAAVLAGTPLAPSGPDRVLLAADAFALLTDPQREALLRVAHAFAPSGSLDLAPAGTTLGTLTHVVRDVQGPEFAAAHRDWIAAAAPEFSAAVSERIAHALQVTPEAEAAAGAVRREVRRHVDALLPPGTLVLAPAAGPPPLRRADDRARAEARHLAAALSVVGSLAGLPTVTVPGVVVDGAPVGLALIGRPGGDGLLLSRAAELPPARPAPGRSAG